MKKIFFIITAIGTTALKTADMSQYNFLTPSKKLGQHGRSYGCVYFQPINEQEKQKKRVQLADVLCAEMRGNFYTEEMKLTGFAQREIRSRKLKHLEKIGIIRRMEHAFFGELLKNNCSVLKYHELLDTKISSYKVTYGALVDNVCEDVKKYYYEEHALDFEPFVFLMEQQGDDFKRDMMQVQMLSECYFSYIDIHFYNAIDIEMKKKKQLQDYQDNDLTAVD